MFGKKIKRIVVTQDNKVAIWFPPEAKDQIVEDARELNMPIWRYVVMLRNNYKILREESKK
jgi:hypothetical protein